MLRAILLAALLAAAGQSVADPHADYLLYCRGCHLHTGDPVPDANVPGLHELAPMLATQEGRDYLIRVPGVSQSGMSDAQVAAVLNWVFTEFNADTVPRDFKRFTEDEVSEVRHKVLVDPLKAREEILANE